MEDPELRDVHRQCEGEGNARQVVPTPRVKKAPPNGLFRVIIAVQARTGGISAGKGIGKGEKEKKGQAGGQLSGRREAPRFHQVDKEDKPTVNDRDRDLSLGGDSRGLDRMAGGSSSWPPPQFRDRKILRPRRRLERMRGRVGLFIRRDGQGKDYSSPIAIAIIGEQGSRSVVAHVRPEARSFPTPTSEARQDLLRPRGLHGDAKGKPRPAALRASILRRTT